MIPDILSLAQKNYKYKDIAKHLKIKENQIKTIISNYNNEKRIKFRN